MPDLNPAVLSVAGGVAVYAGGNSPYNRAVGLGLDGPVRGRVRGDGVVFRELRAAGRT